jgi:hypothetical protein
MSGRSLSRIPFDKPWAQYVPDGVPYPTSDDGIRELVALGGLVQASSPLETLRMLYCVLLDSKFTAVTAAGQNASWLNENRRAIPVVTPSVPSIYVSSLAGLPPVAVGSVGVALQVGADTLGFRLEG